MNLSVKMSGTFPSKGSMAEYLRALADAVDERGEMNRHGDIWVGNEFYPSCGYTFEVASEGKKMWLDVDVKD